MASPVQTAVKDIRRLRDILQVLSKYGFGALLRSTGLSMFISETDELEPLDSGEHMDIESMVPEDVEDPEELFVEDRNKTALRFRNVLEDLGPTFVKFGQVLSTRPDLMPPEFIDELQNLQDQATPLETDQLHEQLQQQLAGEPDEVFKSFNEEPIAAASIAQVHRAILKDGREVAVKVQRPGIREKIQSDLDILYYIARFLEATIKELELYTPTAIVEEFEQAILTELDFDKEAASMEEFRSNFEEVEKTTAPEVVDELSSEQVLVMKHVDGMPLTDVEGGTDRAERLLDTLLDAMVKMVLYDGFFHGDPHPGNILAREDDTLVFIDFGLVGRISPAQQDTLIEHILATLMGDIDTIARTTLQMGYPTSRVNLKKFKADITRLRDKYMLERLEEIRVSEFVREVMNTAQEYRIRLNPNYAVLTKASMTIEGIMRHLKPDLDIMKKGRPYARELALHRFSAKKIMRGVLSSALGASGFIQQLPEQMDQVLMDLESGTLTLQVENDSLAELGPFLNTLGTRLFLGVFGAGLAVSAAIVLQGFEYSIQGVSVRFIVGILLAVGAFTLFWWALGWHIVGGSKSKKIKVSPLMRLFRDE